MRTRHGDRKVPLTLRNPHNHLNRNASPEIASFVCVGVCLRACASFNFRFRTPHMLCTSFSYP
jgi:hypothetical protein